MHKIAIYDMDKTITRRPTVAPFLIHAFWRLAPWRVMLLPAIGLASLGYLLKLVDRARLKEISVRLLIGPAMPVAMAKTLARETLDGNILPQALAQIAADKAAGYRPLLATASLYFYSNEIGAIVGIDDVVATMNQVRADGSISPRIDGENCYGAAKLAKVEAWLATQGIARHAAHLKFYTDHVSDAPLLEFADEAYAVNPHKPLRALAAKKGWAVMDWR
jgi:HAD superfamily hydrolase (TIGR01490 family)